MSRTLLDLVRSFADTHADRFGAASTPIPGLTAIRATQPGELQVAVNRPLVAMLLQGAKRVTIGAETLEFGPGESLLISADVPTVSQITQASLGAPYYSLVLELDPVLMRELAVEMAAVPGDPREPVRVEPTDADVADVALRLMRLLDRPSALPVLQGPLLREIHFWLLAGRHGSALRSLGGADGHAQRIACAVAMIRESYARPIRIEELAEAAGMSTSSFHQHFRQTTTLSPLQFQKQLRLIEARRQMLADGTSVSSAAYAVGYESVPQFTREYGRLFGKPPARDIRQAQMDA
ncbi:AraC family transcriptional regulator [Mesorhizobium sp. M00.F.Ca.ET.216.01.1.1]|uniref:AraC family transcriptional regulator n=1 Tax=Mesorhizobium sp. M00.F.Ca.ET.216.01.1.1 TaxID=2500528 RepID=UPI000FDA7A4D|nr:AraC family transcriptional regulator [Mesorhizobium sp. M00.F.Ca.ET.216.01.1.1]TGQ32781.1 AraC family transcriptional regulator [Mesorhizobium sp. M00.F.Ca.ET.216.01.1.1]TJW39432.1 MAG: helix-turn-helix domain-containing protein [Mesorhizobium sp.]